MAGEGMKIFLQVDGMLTEVITTELAAYRYNYAKTTIRQWADEGKLIAYKVAGVLLIPVSEIDRFLKRDSATQNVAS
jgi:excisionase family DNA binding protein